MLTYITKVATDRNPKYSAAATREENGAKGKVNKLYKQRVLK